MKVLTDSQIHDFNENGYLLIEDALAQDDLNPLIAEFEEVDSRYQDAAKSTGYQPEAGFLARSRLHPEDVVTTPEEFKSVRDEHQPGPGPNRWAKEEASDA